MHTRRTFLKASALLALAGEASAEAVAGSAARRGRAPGQPPGATGSQPSRADTLTWAELPLEPWRGKSYRALVLRPAQSGEARVYPGLLLFHGRGESRHQQLGLHAWRTRYGLEQSDARARHVPLALDDDQRRYIRPEQLRALEDALRAQPFSGLIYICPFTPNPHRAPSAEALLDDYSEWLERALLPTVRAHAPLAPNALGVDGCSMGGFVAAEVFGRKPHLFQTFGVVQAAFGAHRAAAYASALAAAQDAGTLQGIHLETSTLDPYRSAVEALGQQLGQRRARFQLDVLPGPHDQPWLRSTGTLTMLTWHERLLRAGSAGGPRPALETSPAAR